ncbi:unnamed protein product [Cyprideis torosa]|uniref:Uncharacterized protein n=1 Tax=Cyprideis torosa TaxID=163714 RepID=A0A7R8WJ72_9CRUS|nr:unnamed protein product [Cyprideis torosa]CAG0901660.1 unnamed protein product [Cyprideis torosa]
MNSEVEKEPSDFEVPRADDGYALPKFDGMEVLTDHHKFPVSSETATVTDVVQGYTNSDSETGGAPDQIEFDGMEVLTDHHKFSVSSETATVTDVVQGYTNSDSETGGAPDQIEFSEDEGTVRRGKNSRGHCQRKKRFTCDVCGKSLSTKQHLQSHEFTHTGEKPFSCRICGKSFAQSSNLSTHKLTHTGQKPFGCRICGKAFGDNANLRKHELIHSGGKPFACRICGRSFTRSSSLSSHKLIHTGEKQNLWQVIRTQRQFIVPQVDSQWICGKSFGDSSHLSRHKLIHTGQKPFACRICGKLFAQSWNLTTHKLTHTGGRPFSCSVCEKAFNQQSHLRTHEFTHKKEKRFHCLICGDGFRSKSGLHNHEKKHSEGNQSTCALCGQPFRLVEDLEKHLKKYLSCPVRGAFLKMNSEVEKEPSGVEIQREDVGFALPKFDGMEVLAEHHEFAESGETAAPTDTVPGYTDNDNQTGDASDQIEVSEDEGTVRKGKNSRGHCQRKKRFTCAVCGKSLSTKRNLQSHKFTHTGQKPFACRICLKSFAQSSVLARHSLQPREQPTKARIHPQKREALPLLGWWKCIPKQVGTYCSVCGKAFNQESNLRRHEFTHKKEKRFHCSVGGNVFRSKSGLKDRENKHSEGNQSVCALCDQPFPLVEDLEKHLKWHIQSGS